MLLKNESLIFFFNLVGLVDTETDEEFIVQLESLKEVWDTRERERVFPQPRHPGSLITFRRKLHNIIINPWFKCLLTPPAEYNGLQILYKKSFIPLNTLWYNVHNSLTWTAWTWANYHLCNNLFRVLFIVYCFVCQKLYKSNKI